MLATKAKRLPVQLSLISWHTLVVRTKGDEQSVIIEGKTVGSFQSPGIARDTESLVSHTTNPLDVHYDDFSLKGTVSTPTTAKR